LPRFSYQPGQSVLAALNQSDLPSVPAAFQEVIDSGAVRESMQIGTCPRWTSDSPTTLRAGSSACGPSLDQRDCPPQASPLRPVAAEGVLDSSAAAFEPRLPVPLLVEGVVHVDRGVVIGMGFIVAHRTAEQLAPLLSDADPTTDGEPLPPGSTTRAVLRCPMRIGFLCRQILHSLNHKDSIVEAAGSYNAALDLIHTALWAESEGERYTGVLYRLTLAFALRV